MWYKEYNGSCAAVCGEECGYAPITKEEKVALLELKEKRLEEKLEYVRKIRESLKSEKPAKDK